MVKPRRRTSSRPSKTPPSPWYQLYHDGFVQHPSDPERFRTSALGNAFDEDGAYVGGARDGYLDMMHDDAIPFLIYRANFDGTHDSRFESYLRTRILQRYPFNGVLMPQGFFEGGYNSPDSFLSRLVRPDFPDAALYRWAIEHPVEMTEVDLYDPSIASAGPLDNTVVEHAYAVMSSDLSSPNAVTMRMRAFPPGPACQSGTFQTYLGGAFNIAAYGQRMAIERGGYHRVDDYDEGTSQRRKNTILIDEQNDPSFMQVRAWFRRYLTSGPFDYAELQTDLDSSHASSAYVAGDVDLTRRGPIHRPQVLPVRGLPRIIHQPRLRLASTRGRGRRRIRTRCYRTACCVDQTRGSTDALAHALTVDPFERIGSRLHRRER